MIEVREEKPAEQAAEPGTIRVECRSMVDGRDLSESVQQDLIKILTQFAWEKEADAPPTNEGGRGFVRRMVSPEGTPFVIRRYHRGGLMRKISKVSFLSLNGKMRPFREFMILRALSEAGLRVPRPAAAVSVSRFFNLVYRGAIATYEIPEARNLLEAVRSGLRADVLEYASLLAGKEAAKALRYQVHHTDLHLANVVLTGSGESWLIDFDRWKNAVPSSGDQMVARWARSVRKHAAPEIMIGAFAEGIRSKE